MNYVYKKINEPKLFPIRHAGIAKLNKTEEESEAMRKTDNSEFNFDKLFMDAEKYTLKGKGKEIGYPPKNQEGIRFLKRLSTRWKRKEGK